MANPLSMGNAQIRKNNRYTRANQRLKILGKSIICHLKKDTHKKLYLKILEQR